MLRQLETRETCGVPEDFRNDIKDNRLQYTLAEAEEWSQMLRQMEKKQALDIYARAFLVGGKDLDPKIPSRFVNDFAELS
jgi:hypothetical protein